jgi:hypothetical protein
MGDMQQLFVFPCFRELGESSAVPNMEAWKGVSWNAGDLSVCVATLAIPKVSQGS